MLDKKTNSLIEKITKVNDFLEIRGQSYKIDEFYNTSLLPLLKLVRDGLENFDDRKNAGAEIKEIIVPTIPNSIIKKNLHETYIFNASSEEIGLILSQCIRTYYQRLFNEVVNQENLTPKSKKDLVGYLTMIANFQKIETDANALNQMIEDFANHLEDFDSEKQEEQEDIYEEDNGQIEEQEEDEPIAKRTIKNRTLRQK